MTRIRSTIPTSKDGGASAEAASEGAVDGRVSRAQRLREARRAQLLATARDLFAEHGYHETSIHDIILAAGIARGTFYLYFESKRAVFDQLLDDFFVTISGAVKRIDTAPSAPPPLEQMHDNVRRIFAAIERERPMARIVTREAVGLDQEFDRKLTDFYGRVADLIERGLRLGVEMGLVRPCAPQMVSYCVLGSVKEVIDRVFVVGEGDDDLEGVGRALVDFVLRGVFL